MRNGAGWNLAHLAALRSRLQSSCRLTHKARCKKTEIVKQARFVVYWDASAILSVLFHDRYSTRATAAARREATHFISTLGYAEVIAVVARLERERKLPTLLADAARELLRSGPWQRLTLQPDWATIDDLAARWPLRGADLWHLATASTLSRELPELRMITFDSRLDAASQGIGLAFGN